MQGDITIRGTLDGQQWERVLSIGAPAGNTGLSTLWARSKIAALLDEMVTGTPEAVIRPQVVDLAMKHQLASRCTSFVAIDKTPVKPVNTSSSEHQVANQMPAGNTMGMPFPATATVAGQHFYIGLLLLIMGMISWLAMRRKGLPA